MTTPILKLNNITKKFASITAVDDLSIGVKSDLITSIIGPNGAGKTTTFNLISGSLSPDSGTIEYDGDSIQGMPPYRIARKGVVRSYQITNFYPDLTCLENVRIAAQARYSGLNIKSFLTDYRKLEEPIEIAHAVLERVDLNGFAEVPANNLAHGQQRHLEIAIALATDPKVLLLDEPTAGMSSEETKETTTLIEDIADEMSILLIEHDMDLVMDISDRIGVMHQGSLISFGQPNEVRNNLKVQKAYLGGISE